MNSMKKHTAIMLLALLVSMLIACSAKLASYTKETCAAQPGDELVAVITDKCNLCHSKDFASKADICGRKALIRDAVQAGRMPKFGRLSPEQKKLILDWK
jgi:hypothetical protein